jgi:hypothetical protein
MGADSDDPAPRRKHGVLRVETGRPLSFTEAARTEAASDSNAADAVDPFNRALLRTFSRRILRNKRE